VRRPSEQLGRIVNGDLSAVRWVEPGVDLIAASVLSAEDVRADRLATDWHAWEAGQVVAAIEPGDSVFEVGAPASALTGALAGRAGWVFAAATDDDGLSALRTALDPVHPPNLTYGPSHILRDWCPSAEVVVAGDWVPQTSDRDAELSSLLVLAERRLIVTGWRSEVSTQAGDPADLGVELALAFARRRGLETRIRATPVEQGRQRAVVIITRGRPRA
jgi:hypothetical protein